MGAHLPLSLVGERFISQGVFVLRHHTLLAAFVAASLTAVTALSAAPG